MRIRSTPSILGQSHPSVSNTPKKRIKPIKALPRAGDKLHWSGTSIYELASIQRVLNAKWPGILQPRRSMLPLLSSDTGAVLPSCCTLVLDEPFIPVSWWGCPVFLAHTEGADSGQRVVLKLMYMDAREPGENVSMDEFDFVRAETLVKFAKSEANAYAALEKGQGSILPYCYGFYEFRLANGNVCIGQVIEYVDGFAPSEYASTLRKGVDDDKIDAFLTNLYRTLIELHKCGVIHKDQASRNIRLLYPLEPLHPRFVIFDFGYSILAKDWVANTDPMLSPKAHPDSASIMTGERTADHWLKMDEQRMKWFMEECGKGIQKSGWEKTKKGKELLALWKTHPEDLSEEEKVPAWYSEMSEMVRAKL